MRGKRFLKFLVLLIVVAPLLVFVVGQVVLHLWNWLLPPLFGWHALTFWQALGLLALCRILFGGLGHHNGHHDRGKWRGCKRMTPEEREKFRQAMREGFEFGPSTGQGAAH